MTKCLRIRHRIGLCLVVISSGVGLAPQTALGAPPAPRLSAADRRQIGVLLDQFVKDAVRRENLPAAWQLAGPELRGGTTRQAWDSGTGVTVPYFPVQGSSFRTAWTGKLVAAGHAELSMILHPTATAKGYDETAATIDVRKLHGRWVVDLFYAAAVFHASGGISGPNDFLAGGGNAQTSSSRIAGGWLLGTLALVGGLLVLTPLAVWARLRRRDRRARAAFERHSA
jgi:hypothetical protein